MFSEEGYIYLKYFHCAKKIAKKYISVTRQMGTQSETTAKFAFCSSLPKPSLKT